RWAHGLADGLWLGLTSVPRTPLVPGSSPSASFLPFRRDQPARRLRVGLLARIYPPHPNTGGIARYTQELAHALHTLGHEVHVFTEQRERVVGRGFACSSTASPPRRDRSSTICRRPIASCVGASPWRIGSSSWRG